MPRPQSAPPPNPRLTELAAILANAILRLRSRSALESQLPSATCLEVPPETVLSDHDG